MAVYDELETPLGTLRVVMDSVGVSRVALTEEDWGEIQQEFHDLVRDPESCRDAVRQLEEYFSGRRRAFDVALSLPEDSPFRRRVWAALREIPYGQVRSYGEIAAAIGNPRAVRAVGQANRANPLPIFIPCHRVVGKKRDLVGYAGSRTDLKAHLLRLEGVLAE